MPTRRLTCQAEFLNLNPVVICDKPTTVYFVLARPFLPVMAGPSLPPMTSIDACEEHAHPIERELIARGYHPRRVLVMT